LVLCLDTNENIYRAELGWQLTDLHGLGMKEVVGDFTGRWLGATFFRGREPIDAIWATSDLKVAHACIMPVGYRVGDHHLFVVDFSTASMIGKCPPKILCPALRRLNTKIPGCAFRYNWALQKNILHHQLLERMIRVAESEASKEAISAKFNQLDQEGEQYMKHAGEEVIGMHFFLPRGITMNSSVPGIPLSPLVACWKDSEPGQFKVYCLEMPDQRSLLPVSKEIEVTA
jgi:hypothetical protein